MMYKSVRQIKGQRPLTYKGISVQQTGLHSNNRKAKGNKYRGPLKRSRRKWITEGANRRFLQNMINQQIQDWGPVYNLALLPANAFFLALAVSRGLPITDELATYVIILPFGMWLPSNFYLNIIDFVFFICKFIGNLVCVGVMYFSPW